MELGSSPLLYPSRCWCTCLFFLTDCFASREAQGFVCTNRTLILPKRVVLLSQPFLCPPSAMGKKVPLSTRSPLCLLCILTPPRDDLDRAHRERRGCSSTSLRSLIIRTFVTLSKARVLFSRSELLRARYAHTANTYALIHRHVGSSRSDDYFFLGAVAQASLCQRKAT